MILHEKYRPQSLDQVLGQDKAVSQVKMIIERRGGFGGRAVMITGKSGQGKTTLARIIAGSLADSFNVTEFDAIDCTPYRIGEIEDAMQIYGMGEKSGRVWIVNEYHAMKRDSVAKWLTVLERIPAHCCVVFTSTIEGSELFEDQMDSSPFASRCIQIALAQRGVGQAFAQRALEIARMEGLDGQPLAKYLRLVEDCKGNFREVLQVIDGGGMLV
jgi:replication-associated recombination protein RarA